MKAKLKEHVKNTVGIILSSFLVNCDDIEAILDYDRFAEPGDEGYLSEGEIEIIRQKAQRILYSLREKVRKELNKNYHY